MALIGRCDMGRKSKRHRQLTDDEVARLNVEFYGSFPYDEMTYQVATGLLMLEPREELIRLLTTNTPCGRLHVRMDEVTPEKLRGAAALGTVVLSQHIAETLLRLLFVHSSGERCTWAALARLRGNGVVRDIAKDILADTIAGVDLAEAASEHILGSRVRTNGPIDDYDAVLANIVDWVKYAAGVAEGSHLYNAYKHGLTLSYRAPIPLQVSAAGESYDDSMDPSLSYLRGPLDREARRCAWVQDFESIDVEQRATASLVLLHLTGNVVFIGAVARSVPCSVESTTWYPSTFTPESVAREKNSPYVIEFAPIEYGSLFGEKAPSFKPAVEQGHRADGAR